MRRSYLYCTVALVALVAGFYSCKKTVKGIDNSNVIATPYTLYYSDTSGNLYKTNDGTSHSEVFSADGFPCRSLCVSGNNILFAKTNLYVSQNNGVNFNHAFDSLLWINRTTCNGTAFNLNQSMMIELSDWNRIYTVSGVVHDPANNVADYLGVEYSSNHGIRGSFISEASYDTNGRTGLLPVSMVSYTRLANGVLAGLAINRHADGSTGIVDTSQMRNFYKACADCPWIEVTGNAIYGATDGTGEPLPPTATYPDTGFFTLGHYNNRLIAIDQTCHYGAFYSDDTGRIWKKYNGLPTGIPMLCIASPFEQICMVGTYGAGLYILNPNTQVFEAHNKGLGSNIIVRNIAAKQNLYKNGTTKRFIYLATNKGIFQSSDDGANWVLTIPGNYTAVY